MQLVLHALAETVSTLGLASSCIRQVSGCFFVVFFFAHLIIKAERLRVSYSASLSVLTTC